MLLSSDGQQSRPPSQNTPTIPSGVKRVFESALDIAVVLLLLMMLELVESSWWWDWMVWWLEM
jgi:hypothetical protein